jgi:hypothetical protein
MVYQLRIKSVIHWHNTSGILFSHDIVILMDVIEM